MLHNRLIELYDDEKKVAAIRKENIKIRPQRPGKLYGIGQATVGSNFKIYLDIKPRRGPACPLNDLKALLFLS